MSRFSQWELPFQGATLRLAITAPPAGRSLVDVVDPFLTLSDRGAFSRTLLASLVGPGGDLILPVVLKLQTDEYPISVANGAARLTNADIEAGWFREVAVAEHCSARGPGIPPVVEVLRRERGAPAVLPPTFFCKKTGAFFLLPCPSCGQPLADVRDELLLEARDLPAFDRSLERFITCLSCAATGEVRLWTLVKDPDKDTPDIGDQADLIRELGELAQRELLDGDDAIIPCQGCEHLRTCHPRAGDSGDAHRFLVALTFYEARCIVMPLYHLRYDELVALLGGATVDDITTSISEPGRLAALMPVRDRLGDGHSQFFFEHDVAGKFGLEVLRLKLSAFRELCQAVCVLHRFGQHPHLGISPARALVQVLETSRGQPAMWNFAVGLVGLGNARPRSFRVGRAKDLPSPPFLRPVAPDPIFSAPALLEIDRADQPCTLKFTSIKEVSKGEVVVEATVSSEAIDLNGVGQRDTVTVSVVQARPPLSLSLLGYPIGSARGVLHVRSVPFALGEQGRMQVEQLLGQTLPRARISVFPCLHAPCDVHSLGMTLLATLLVNSEQAPEETARVVGRIGDSVAQFAQQRPSAGFAEISAHAIEILDSDFARGALDRSHLFHHPKRHLGAAAGLPLKFWRESLLVGIRAITRIRGFSVCRGYSDFDPVHPEVNVEFLLQLVDALIRKVDAALFGLPGRSREIRAAIARVSTEALQDEPASMLDDRTRVLPMS